MPLIFYAMYLPKTTGKTKNNLAPQKIFNKLDIEVTFTFNIYFISSCVIVERPTRGKSISPSTVLIILCVIPGLLFLVLLVLCVYCLYRKRNNSDDKDYDKDIKADGLL